MGSDSPGGLGDEPVMTLAEFVKQLNEILANNPGLDLDTVPVVISCPGGEEIPIAELSCMDDEDGEYGGRAVVFVEMKE